MEVIGDVVREVNGENPRARRVARRAAGRLEDARRQGPRGRRATCRAPADACACSSLATITASAARWRCSLSSGWDILFASDDFAVHEALENIKLDAVIAELDAGDPRIEPIMDDVRKAQPGARRIVPRRRSHGRRCRTSLRRARLRPRSARRCRDREPARYGLTVTVIVPSFDVFLAIVRGERERVGAGEAVIRRVRRDIVASDSVPVRRLGVDRVGQRRPSRYRSRRA